MRLPDALSAELENYRRRMRVHDRMSTLDVGLLTQRWRDASPSRGWLACVVCGAPSSHRPGVTAERCAHCGATIVPSEQRLHDDVAGAAEWEQRLSARREARQREASSALQRASGRALLFNLGAFALASMVTAAMSVGGFLVRSDALGWRDVPMLALPFLAFVVIPGILLLYLARRSFRQRRRWTPVWAGLAEQLDGTLLSAHERNAWFVRWWFGRGAPRSMYKPSAAAGAIAVPSGGGDSRRFSMGTSRATWGSTGPAMAARG